MTSISLRLSENLLRNIDDNAEKLHLSRTSYIREAVRQFNAAVLAESRRKRLMQVSKQVRNESMKINQEFSDIEDDPEV